MTGEAVGNPSERGREEAARAEREPDVTRSQPAATEGTLPLREPHQANGEPLILGRYRLDRRLGAGGFGVVWRAFDERLEREVAVKVVPGDGGGRVDREARAAARLNHPGIVALYELAADESDVYLMSELVRGRTLADLARDGALSDRDVARIGVALCEALEHAHARGVVHRDVKPQNVMVVAEPAAGSGFAKLTDFGVAHVAGGDPMTRTGDVVGTLAYMAPEQAEGRRAAPASDVYSLALTLFEAFAGWNPVRANGPAATARRLGRRLPSLRTRRRDLPLELCDAIDEGLHPSPERRPSLEELRAALHEGEPDLSDEGGLVGARLGLPELPTPPRIPARAASGVGTGLLVLAALGKLGPAPPLSPLAAGCAAALVVILVPRLGWLVAAIGVCGWLASPEAGRAGTALMLAAALAPIPLLLPRAPNLWSLPALAPALGAASLAPAFVGVAGLGSTARRRAGLACAGFGWLAAAELLAGKGLLFGLPDGARPRLDWQGSVTGALGDALGPLLTSPALAAVVVWVAFAAALPLVVRGRVLVLDLVGAGVWAAGLAAAHAALGDLLAASTSLGQPRGPVAGPVLAAAIALAAAWVVPREGPASVPATVV
jgi:eukaryotic-like serine/threonine-protein kinase